ncbi:uncharacterized protein LOC132704402 isoform X2 [Cylas formicarius]|uniref:uncharacterized protein LOC132704402 isoform X2 n=1 Tax=Cylas formicarius TaxID=197179 RepID=UPI002958D4C2|nr:uncharacterized protein LOC132704402 isoform X2 [Cylas formicarius]
MDTPPSPGPLISLRFAETTFFFKYDPNHTRSYNYVGVALIIDGGGFSRPPAPTTTVRENFQCDRERGKWRTEALTQLHPMPSKRHVTGYDARFSNDLSRVVGRDVRLFWLFDVSAIMFASIFAEFVKSRAEETRFRGVLAYPSPNEMAARIKKQTANSREIASPQSGPSKSDQTASEPCPAPRSAKQNVAGIAKRLAKRMPPKKIIKKTAGGAIKMKAKTKKPLKIKMNRLAKALQQNGKGLETKKRLLKNGLRGGKTANALEPIFPPEEHLESKKTRKRIAKKPLPKLIDVKKIKSELLLLKTEELVDHGESPGDRGKSDGSSSAELDSKPVRRPAKPKKSKTDSATIEEVMNDLTFLIKGEDIKKEPDSMSESSRSDSLKPTRKLTKRQRIDLLKKEIKKENIENTLSKLDADEKKIIDMLDLNVSKIRRDVPATKRRHSIEKFPLNCVESEPVAQLSIFNQLPRCISPKTSKKPLKIRHQSLDGIVFKRNSPYTRSDSPVRILRNGKHRKLKDAILLDGLDEVKRRRRLCSDLSSSKLSEYDSDSSFSDMASLHGSEPSNNKELDNLLDEYSIAEQKPKTPLAVMTVTDTNSNLCGGLTTQVDPPVAMVVSPSSKVPDKGLILDIMKQTFNDTQTSLQKCEVSKFYGRVKQDEAATGENCLSPKEKGTTPEGDFASEDKEAEEQRSFENMVQECIESIGEIPRDVSLDDSVPVIENMAEAVDFIPRNEDLEPPQLECSVEPPSKATADAAADAPPCIEELGEEATEKVCDIPIEAVEEAAKEEEEEESPEQLAKKESILKALGLQSLRAAEQAKQQRGRSASKRIEKNESYTGTLKTVIKINRDKKKGRSSFKMTLQKSKSKSDNGEQSQTDEGYKIMKEGAAGSGKQGKESSDSAGAHRKSHYSNRSNMEASSEHTSDGESTGPLDKNGAPAKALVIPEKASSFSIHPGRLCKDECSYCFGKFGLFDTPCHIAQMKSVERQNKILATEKHLTRDSCLCDACYRHVDRKSNTPSYTNKSLKRNSLVAPGPRQNHCHVLGCSNVSSNILRRKWIIKMRKSICQVINIDLDNPGLHSIPICDEHYNSLEHLMVCAMCKRRLARNHIHYLGPEVKDLNSALNDEGIPLTLCDKPVVCKLCKCFASVILKDPEERPDNSASFFEDYKKRLLHYNDIVPMDAAAAEEPIVVPSKADKMMEKESVKKKKRDRHSSGESSGNVHTDSQNEFDKCDNLEDHQTRLQNRVPSTDTNNSQSQSRSESPDDEYSSIDYNTLIPTINLECPSDSDNKKEAPRKMTVKEAVEVSKNFKVKVDKAKPNDLAMQKLGQNPSISLRPACSPDSDHDSWDKRLLSSNPAISVRQLFPGEEELPLTGQIDFNHVKEQTPEGWKKCSTTIQYDEETKHLWQELQKPYGNQSSFLRHLILLEKYFRNGDLMLSPTASHHAINYRESVHNRLRAYDNIPSNAGNIQPISMIPFNKMHKTSGGVVITAGGQQGSCSSQVFVPQLQSGSNGSTSTSAPITLQQLNSPPLIPPILQNFPKAKSSGTPPGLISLNAGTSRPAPKGLPQGQKIKFPITKNWRPNLIPIDPTRKHERKTGLVQVISGGKPYHITLEDYKKMCAIKRSFEAKQKKLQQEQQQSLLLAGHHNSVLKSIMPRKGLVISRTNGTEVKAAGDGGETILEKLDRQVEKLGQESRSFGDRTTSMLLPRIPKSLTVIPQMVRKAGPPSPVLVVAPKAGGPNGHDQS